MRNGPIQTAEQEKERSLKICNHMRRNYASPLSKPTEVAFESALLVGTVELLLQVDPLRNMSSTDAYDGEAGSDTYFEF